MSQRHPGSRRTQHHRSDEPDDAFIARVLHLGKWAESNQQALTVAAVVLAIGVFGLVSWRNSRDSMNQAAATELETIHQSIGISDTQGARDALITFLDRFAGSAYEGEARLLLGQLYLEGGDAQQALAVLNPIGASPRAPIEFQAATLLGAAYEHERRWSDAEQIYLTIARRSDLDFQIRNALVSAARIRSGQGNPQGAIELYERAMESLDENAPERARYQMRIEELRVASNI